MAWNAMSRGAGSSETRFAFAFRPFECEHIAAFLCIRKPKSRRRGRGRVQHLKIERPEVVRFLDSVSCELDSFLPLFPLSASVFRARGDKLLRFLWVPKRRRPTPASIRGGGAMQAYRPGKSLQSILWRMRLISQSTLESYLQELAAESFLVQLPESAKDRIRFVSSFFPLLLNHPRETQTCTARATGDGPTKGGLAASVQTLLHPFVASLFG